MCTLCTFHYLLQRFHSNKDFTLMSIYHILILRIIAFALTIQIFIYAVETERATANVIVDPIHQGNSNIVPGITVYGAAVVSLIRDHDADKNVTLKRFHITITVSRRKIAEKRLEYVKNLTAALMFPVVQWPGVFTEACAKSYHRNPVKYERGLAYAHFQIWQDFVYFEDNYNSSFKTFALHAQRKNPNWQADVDRFYIDETGQRYKNGVKFLENDILVVFEDDAEIATSDYNTTLIEEFEDMISEHEGSDLLYVGWCTARIFGEEGFCAHAYAVTRLGARILVNRFTPCGLALDIQISLLCKDKILRCKKVHPNRLTHYNALYPKGKGIHGFDHTEGIFHQADVYGWFFPKEYY